MQKRMSFQELINGEQPVLVDFTAEWCGPCRAMAPILKEVAAKVGDKAQIVKVDVDQNQELAAQLGIMGVPTFILYRRGEVKWRQSGMRSAQALTHVIEQVVNNEL